MSQRYTDFWADGHYIAAEDAEAAQEECRNLYGHNPDTVRPWRNSDNDSGMVEL